MDEEPAPRDSKRRGEAGAVGTKPAAGETRLPTPLAAAGDAPLGVPVEALENLYAATTATASTPRIASFFGSAPTPVGIHFFIPLGSWIPRRSSIPPEPRQAASIVRGRRRRFSC